MASLESMKKEELLAHVRKISQELKYLAAENEQLKNRVDTVRQSNEDATFDSYAVTLKKLSATDYETRLLKYSVEGGQTSLVEAQAHKSRHMAEFAAKKFLFETVLKGEL